MAVSAQRLTVGATAVALNTAATAGATLTITNTDSTNGVDLGPTGVTAGAGYALGGSQSVTIDIDPGDVLFAIRAGAADAVLSILRT